MRKIFWEHVRNYQTAIAFLLATLGIVTLTWKTFGDPFVCKIVNREVTPIYKTLDYLIACNQAALTSEQIQRADSLYSVNQKWKELRSK
jgi:hypothetical protein